MKDKNKIAVLGGGDTGHAEVIKITYKPGQLTYKEILQKFFKIHNPTTKDKQGPDKGSQYRSIILYQDQEQKNKAEEFIEQKQKEYEDKIVTEIKELDTFYKAEERHQDYFEKNPDDAYCRMHAQPKIDKLKGK
ncbi:MAG: peptide-methionine (S)-S-oxide reductase MsrA [Candidatus Nanohaloarchaea archaeon]